MHSTRTLGAALCAALLLGAIAPAFALPPETYYSANVARRGYYDDGFWGAFDIGFTFTFFGNNFTQFYVSSNGVFGFGPTETYRRYSNTCLPTSNVPNSILPFWDDTIVHSDGGVIFYQTIGTAPNRKCVAQYTNMGFYGEPTLLGTYTVILYETTNEIQVQYRILVDPSSVRAHGSSGTFGLNGNNGSTSYQLSCNSANAIQSEQAFRYTPSGGTYTVNDEALYEGILLGDVQFPTIPVLQSPAHGSTVNLRPTFRWSATDYTEGYTFKISTSSNLSGSTNTNVGTATEYTPPSNLNDGTTYYWAVFANGSENVTWSEIHSFTASSSAPPTAVPQTVWTTLGVETTIQLQGTGSGGELSATIATLPESGALYQYDGAAAGDPITAFPAAVTDGSMRVVYMVNDGLVGTNRGNFRFTVSNGEQTSGPAEVTVNVYPAPTVTTAAVTEISPPTATCGGTVLDDNGYAVTARGVCWGTSPNPTAGGAHTENGTGTGAFTSTLTGLSIGNTYYVRAYAINEQGTGYGNQVTFTVEPDPPTVTTAALSAIDGNSAVCGGEVTSDGGGTVTARGVCWSTSSGPTVADDTTRSGTGTGTFTSDLTGLALNTRYYVRAYATNQVATVYGAEREFRTGGALLTVGETGCDFPTIQAALDDAETVGDDTIQVEDSLHTEAGIGVLKSVVIRGHGADSTIVQAHANPGSATDRVIAVGDATVRIQDMTIRYGKTTGAGGGIANGGDLTLARCVIRDNAAVGGPTKAVAEGGGLRSMNGKIALQDCAILNNFTEGGGGGMVLVDSATIHRCVIAGNSAAYGGGIVLSSEHQELVNCTISGNTASGSGGGAYVFYNTASMINCTVSGNSAAGEGAGGIQDGSGVLTLTSTLVAGNEGTPDDLSGTFPSGGYNLIGDNTGAAGSFPAGLPNGNDDWAGTSETPIDARLQALADNGGPTTTHRLLSGSAALDKIPEGTNGMGTAPLDVDQRGESRPAMAAGDIGAFESHVIPPTVVTVRVVRVGSGGAFCNAEVTDDGGGELDAKGVCWSTADTATIADPHSDDGTGTGAYQSEMTHLAPNTTYHVRAYATNAAGTSYGDILTFTTEVAVPEVITADVEEITTRTARCGGEVTGEGGGAVVARGVCWSIESPPTVEDGHTADGDGTGAFDSFLEDLAPNTVYFVRAYATNAAGTGYGGEKSFATLVARPLVATLSVSAVASSTAVGEGEVTDDGGGDIHARGLCWSKMEYPSVADPHVECGTGPGVFTGALTGLEPNTLYHLRAYAANETGTRYGEDLPFTTSPDPPSVLTVAVNGVTAGGATLSGEVTEDGGDEVTERGICWSESPGPTTADGTLPCGSGTGAFSGALSGLDPNRTYYARAYAVNGAGAGYGASLSFRTTVVLPVVATGPVSGITDDGATGGGEVSGGGGAAVTARGVCWSETANPDLSGPHSEDGVGLGPFTSALTGLAPNRTYHVRAYAVNGAGVAYGGDLTFTTAVALPAVTTAPVTDITAGGAAGGGEVTGGGGAEVVARGICWGLAEDPDLSGPYAEAGSGEGAFSAALTGLEPNRIYFVRAYATNAAGTGYGGQVLFSTEEGPPTVVTGGIVPGAESAEGGGEVVADGGAGVTARGVCWSLSPGPTTADEHTLDGKGLGTFTSELTELEPNRTYYVRAYAVNAHGTGYGDEVACKTLETLPVVVTAAVHALEDGAYRVEGEVLTDGGAEVFARGFCWSVGSDPIPAVDIHVDVGAGVGPFSLVLEDLLPGRTYHLRAFAKNLVGTSVGGPIAFTTPVALPVVATAAAEAVTSGGAVSGGAVTDGGGGEVSARGVCWSLAPGPTLADDHAAGGAGTGSFTTAVAGLLPNREYHLRAWATNEAGTAYGEEMVFTTLVALPSVTTLAVTLPEEGDPVGGGEVIADGGGTVSARGVCWGAADEPDLGGAHTADGAGTGAFTSVLAGCAPGTAYHVRAYATNEAGTAYGEALGFATEAVPPEVLTLAAAAATGSTATASGTVSSAGGAAITARGFCWNTAPDPTTVGASQAAGTGSGPFDATINGLLPATAYHLRAYATNEAGTAYGEELLFETPAVPPSVATLSIGASTESTLVVSGEVIDAGGAPVTARGICWGLDSEPVREDASLAAGSGLGAFQAEPTGLEPNTTYHVRAWAANAAGTGYGAVLSSRTEKQAYLSTVTTDGVNTVGEASVECAGTVAGDGGAPVTVRGFCWSLAPEPTVDGDHAEAGSGTGSFTATVSGLEPDRTYYLRAYAMNRVGAAYGEPVAFGLWSTALSKSDRNPVSGDAAIHFTVSAEAGPARVEVYDVLGRRVRVLDNVTGGNGSYETVWDGRNDAGAQVTSGVYYVRLVTRGRTDCRRIVYLR